METDRLPVLKNLGLQPFRRKRTPVSRDLQAWEEEGTNRCGLTGEKTGIEQAFHRGDLQVVRKIVDMDGQRRIDGRTVKVQIQIAEWNRMRRGRERQKYRGKHTDSPSRPSHSCEF